jgi:hypothetical protein
MARRKADELNALERDIARDRRALAETLLALRRRRAHDPRVLAHAGAKPAVPPRSRLGLAIGGLVGLAFIVPRILVRMSAGRPVGDARDRLP